MNKFLLLSEDDKQVYFGVAADNLSIKPYIANASDKMVIEGASVRVLGAE